MKWLKRIKHIFRPPRYCVEPLEDGGFYVVHEIDRYSGRIAGYVNREGQSIVASFFGEAGQVHLRHATKAEAASWIIDEHTKELCR